MAESLINLIDEGLSAYYQTLNRQYYNADKTGKFKEYIETNEMEDIIEDELQEEGSTLVDFDSDFPLESDIDDEDERNAEILRILNMFAYPKKRDKYQLDVSICSNIEAEYIKEVAAKYEKQMPSIFHSGQDEVLMYYFAAGTKAGFPFLTYMIDSYAKDRAKLYQEKKQSISIEEWTARSKFVQKLKAQHKQKAVKLTQAMANYTKRTLQQLKFTTTFKMDDDLQCIAEYVVSVPQVIVKLMDVLQRSPPFQVDLLVAVHRVISTVGDEHKAEEEEDDDDDVYDEKDADTGDIGDIEARLGDKFPVYHVNNTRAEDGDWDKGNLMGIMRTIENAFRHFSQNIVQQNDDTYPQNRRFSIFLDRRRKNDKTGKPCEDITFFHPPNECNQIPTDYVPEIGFEFVRNCLIPSQNQNENISALDPAGGQLLTFMFNVEQRDCIRCYVIWNGQSMRFEGEHIVNVLPILFKDTDDNKAFVTRENGDNALQKMFDVAIQDKRFEDVYEEVTICA